mgnify:CR=1 FL=1
MKIELEFAAVLNVKDVRSGSSLEIDEGTTVTDLLNRLQIDIAYHKFVIPFVNGRKTKTGDTLQNNDKVFLSLPVGGG